MTSPPPCVQELAVKKEELRLLTLQIRQLKQEISVLEQRTLEWMHSQNQNVPPPVASTNPTRPPQEAREITSIPVNTTTPADISRYGQPGDLRRIVRTTKESVTKGRLVNWMKEYFRQKGVDNWDNLGTEAVEFCYNSRKEVRKEYKIERHYKRKRQSSTLDISMQ